MAAILWQFDRYSKRWTFSVGWGRWAVQRLKNGWLVQKLNWIGNPDCFNFHKTKEAAMREAEKLGGDKNPW
jgi:hypothetical protein